MLPERPAVSEGPDDSEEVAVENEDATDDEDEVETVTTSAGEPSETPDATHSSVQQRRRLPER